MSSYGLKTLMLGIIKMSIKRQEYEVKSLLANEQENCWKKLVKATIRIIYIQFLIHEYVKLESESEQKLLT